MTLSVIAPTAILDVDTAPAASFNSVTAPASNLSAVIALAAITSPWIALTAIFAFVTALSAICNSAIVPVRSTVGTAAVHAPFTNRYNFPSVVSKTILGPV